MKAIVKLKNTVCALVVFVLPQWYSAQTTSQNFIKKTVPISGVTTEATLNALTSSNKVESISYIDGLGRTMQNVLVKASPANYDIVQPIVYDQYGRQSRSYLPYVDATNDASFKSGALTNQLSFYANATMVAKTTTPFADNVFDGSPLNRILERSAPDTDWQLGNGHTSKTEISYNQENDWILKWTIQSNGDVSCAGYDDNYTSNVLQKTTYTDPNGNYSYVFTDKNGRTVCTKQFLEMRGTPAAPYYLTTYLVYDDFGQLVMVIPPKAMDLIESSTNYSVNALTQDLVFKYVYDERHRLIEKKVPGTGWSYIVYNQLNQPVLFRDANLAAQNKWSFIKYDVLGRPVLLGLFNSTGLANYQTRALAQAQFNASQTALGESEVPLDGSNPWGYTNVTLPNTALDILTVNYYDDYDFDNDGTADYAFNTSSIPCITWPLPPPLKTINCTPYTNAVTARTRGYLTGSRVKVLDAANPVQWEVAAVFYDDEGQAIQSQSNDHMGGTDLINMVYDFVGNVTHTHQLHSLSGQSNIEVISHLYYDKMGRLTRVDQKNNADAPVVLSKYAYNELSQVIDKKVHSIDGASFIQSMDYRYTIHGWLSSINNIDLSSDMASNPTSGTNDDTDDLWGMQLSYNSNTTGVNGVMQYAGNVAEKKWRSVTDNVKRAYGYDYDKADRLKSAKYVEYNTGASLWNSNAGRYDEKDISYDANGNITALKRYGYQAATGTFGLIDNLSYQYNGNFLGAVTDAVSTHGQMDFKDNGSTGSNEYTYDGNGNVTANPNKNITAIAYNHLNLPTQITFSGTNKKIEYTYDAAGVRLRKKVTDGAVVTYKDYAGIFEYVNNSGSTVLEAMHTAEGRCIPTNSSGTLTFRYEYQYTDNTGNVVMAFSDMDANGSITPSTEVIQQSHYYAFGMRMEGTNVAQIGTENKYKFGGKEFNDELGLNEYDFGARFYDPAIARWGCIDPMADAAPNWTPFRYGFNNPIVVTDPTGMFEKDWEGNISADASGTGTISPAQQLAIDEQKKCPTCNVEIVDGKVVVTPGGNGSSDAGTAKSTPAPTTPALETPAPAAPEAGGKEAVSSIHAGATTTINGPIGGFGSSGGYGFSGSNGDSHNGLIQQASSVQSVKSNNPFSPAHQNTNSNYKLPTLTKDQKKILDATSIINTIHNTALTMSYKPPSLGVIVKLPSRNIGVRATNLIGKVLGGVAVLNDFNNIYNKGFKNATLADYGKLGVSVGMLWLKSNPITMSVSLIYGFMDAAGVNPLDLIYNKFQKK